METGMPPIKSCQPASDAAGISQFTRFCTTVPAPHESAANSMKMVPSGAAANTPNLPDTKTAMPEIPDSNPNRRRMVGCSPMNIMLRSDAQSGMV